MYRYEEIPVDSEEGEILQLIVRKTRLEDSGNYVCTALNDHGRSSADFHLLVQGNIKE